MTFFFINFLIIGYSFFILHSFYTLLISLANFNCPSFPFNFHISSIIFAYSTLNSATKLKNIFPITSHNDCHVRKIKELYLNIESKGLFFIRNKGIVTNFKETAFICSKQHDMLLLIVVYFCTLHFSIKILASGSFLSFQYERISKLTQFIVWSA